MDPGESVHHYTIVTALGAGGMGEVYLADDRRLGRRVALKLLPPQFARDVDRVRRFEQEARAVSALNHPNILTLFDLGRAGDQYFMATEFIDGRTLRAHIAEEGRLTPAEAIRIATQCAAALASAHAAGIVHRDLKPENVMLRRDGYVKLLDFGLARVVERGSADDETITSVRPNLTSAGVVLGTTAYLSPEQARGQVVDARTDVFSLGIVLYEMLAGTRPFAGPTPSDTLAAILRADPPPLSQVVPDLPPALERIVTKALAKDRDARYASIAELGQDLEAVARDLAFDAHPRARVVPNQGVVAAVALGAVLLIASAAWWMYAARPAPPASPTAAPAGLQRVKTLAVLPFTLIGYSAESEHLGLGMADALIVRLTSIRQLTVRPTSAVQKYQTGEQDVQTVGRALQVDAVLTGHVQRAGSRTRVTVQLVGTTGADAAARSIWSDEFTTTTDDPFEVQERLAAQLVQKLALELSGDEQSKLTAHPTSNPKALQNYMQGRFFANKRTVAGSTRALEFFAEAVRLDPEYPQPYLGQALAWDSLLEFGGANFDETMPKLHAALDRALTLDPKYGEAYGYRSLASRVYDWKFDEADRDSARSMELDPNNPAVLQWRGIHLLAFGRVEEALALHARSVDIDPVDLSVRSQLARAFYLTKRYDDAIRTGRAVLDFDPTQSAAHEWIGLSQAALGRVDESIASLTQAVALAAGNGERLSALAYAYAVGGHAADARKLIAQLEAPRSGIGSAYHIATIHAGLGDRQATLHWLDRAWQERNGFLANRVKLDPKLDLVRQEPQFQELLRRMSLDGR